MGQRPSRDKDLPNAYWEVVDHEVTRRAHNYRIRLQETWNNNTFHEIIFSIQKYYLALDLEKPLTEASPTYYNTVQNYFQEAYDTNRIEPVVQAYTSETNFYRLINEDLADLVSTNNFRDIALSPDASQDRVYWEGSLDVACVIVNHPDLDRYRIKEERKVFRGMRVPNTVLANYCIGNRFMNKTFLSTSKLKEVAERFQGSSEDEVGCICIYTLVPSETRTAIDIQHISNFALECEVLILPYTTFEVTKVDIHRIDATSDQYIIELRECHPKD
jgi:hypothetical protein